MSISTGTIKRLLDRFGSNVVFTRVTSTSYSTSTLEVTENGSNTYVVLAAIVPSKKALRDATNQIISDKQLYMASKDVTDVSFTPKINDTVTTRSIDTTVIKVSAIEIQGGLIGFILDLGV